MSSIISETSPSFLGVFFATDVRILQDPESELVNDLNMTMMGIISRFQCFIPAGEHSTRHCRHGGFLRKGTMNFVIAKINEFAKNTRFTSETPKKQNNGCGKPTNLGSSTPRFSVVD